MSTVKNIIKYFLIVVAVFAIIGALAEYFAGGAGEGLEKALGSEPFFEGAYAKYSNSVEFLGYKYSLEVVITIEETNSTHAIGKIALKYRIDGDKVIDTSADLYVMLETKQYFIIDPAWEFKGTRRHAYEYPNTTITVYEYQYHVKYSEETYLLWLMVDDNIGWPIRAKFYDIPPSDGVTISLEAPLPLSSTNVRMLEEAVSP